MPNEEVEDLRCRVGVVVCLHLNVLLLSVMMQHYLSLASDRTFLA